VDAEFFHPAKRGYLERLAAMPGQPLSAHYAAVREMLDPASAPHGELVRNFDLNDALQPVLEDTREPMPARELGSAKKRFRPGDVVTSRLRAYLRETALVRTSPGIAAVGSSEFIVLRPRSETPRLSRAALLTFLRSRPVQTILQWSQEGNQHPRYSEDALLPIPIPDTLCTISTEMDALFESILTARTRARTLLAAAQRAVEIAIEQSEGAAIDFLTKIH
jgi:type I restriction enzyme S subunit